MSVIKEWNCLLHGPFEGSHPICCEHGCDSKAVVREFRTPPNIGSRMLKQFDAGMKRSSDMYRIGNFRSAREGEAAYGGDAGKDNGMQVLWGEQCKRVLGRSFAELTTMAHRPIVGDTYVPTRDRNNGMRDAATDIGITGRRLPKAELGVPKDDAKSIAGARAITT